jgi:hypothetical protein
MRLWNKVDVKDRPKQTMFGQQAAVGELITQTLARNVSTPGQARTYQQIHAVRKPTGGWQLRGWGLTCEHSTLASTSSADHSQYLAKVSMAMHDSNLFRNLREFEG